MQRFLKTYFFFLLFPFIFKYPHVRLGNVLNIPHFFRLFEYSKKLSVTAAFFKVNGFLSDDREVGIPLYKMVQECLVRGSKATQLYIHGSIKYLDNLSHKLGFEVHRFTGLIRFRILEDGLQYAPFEPDCIVIGHLAFHFKQRLKNRRWILHGILPHQYMPARYWKYLVEMRS